MNQKWLTQLCLLVILAGLFLTGCSNERMEISITQGTGFAPNPEQLQEYLDLRAQLQAAQKEGNPAETARLQTEIDALILRAEGKVPGDGISIVGSAPGSRVPGTGVFSARQLPISDLGKHDPAYWRETAAFYEKERKSGRLQKKLNRAFRDMGLKHLIGVNLTYAQQRYRQLRAQREDSQPRATR